jgi:hypothetical protein
MVDGSTMQSQRGEAWKRFDRFSKGDSRKRLVAEDERYELRRCETTDTAMKWYLAAFDSRREAFERFGRMYPDRWLHFEALGGTIGARYPGLTPTVRVFDVSDNSGFLPFGEAVEIAEEIGLPVVSFKMVFFFSLKHLLAKLSEDASSDWGLGRHQLEGWVLRQRDANGNEVVAKIRVADLKKLVL